MKLVYVGPAGEGVVLPLPDGREIHVAPDGTTPDLPAAFADSLLEQPGNWQPADTAKPAKQPARKEG